MSKWPKVFPPLSPAQQKISDDFMHHWHTVLPKKYSIVDRFGHDYVVGTAPSDFVHTLEIGVGLGEHLAYENLSPTQERGYHALDLRQNMVETLRHAYPRINVIVGDCQQRQPFEDGYFDRIIAIHVLEHLPNLPEAAKELHRLCTPAKGVLQIVIPCEGGLAYALARRVSAKRIFEKRYKQPYKWFIEREHLSVPSEILAELEPYFSISAGTYFPLRVPMTTVNLCVAFNFHPKPAAPRREAVSFSSAPRMSDVKTRGQRIIGNDFVKL
jgi:SAM-dependent methyltransferase